MRDINPELFPSTLTIVDDSGYAEDSSGRYIQQHPKVHTYPFPRNEAELAELIVSAKRDLQVVTKTKMDVEGKLRAALDELVADVEDTRLGNLAKCFAQQADTQFAISFQTRLMGGAVSPAYFFMPECSRYTILYPANDNHALVRDRENGYTAYAHELAHYFDDNRKDGHLHSSSSLFRKCFELDKKLFPNGLAQRAVELSEISGYYADEASQDVLYREYFANSMAQLCHNSYVDSPASPLQKYYELVAMQADEYGKMHTPKEISSAIDKLGKQIGLQARKAEAVANNPAAPPANIMQLVDEAKKPAKSSFWGRLTS